VDAYRKERDTVLANPDAGKAQREAALSVLRADHFDPSEYDRIDAIDLEEIGGE
jgi:lipase chaperone LimK